MNRLASESSLYLRQHASNPVHWWPWCEEAFECARSEDKPVLVSIGYSSCHWCHVMAHECFEDDYIANLMNRLFVNIKVDREERPDVDQIYMESVQMLNQQGGWPLNVFCLPDKRPFTGGTYFPPEDKGHGIIPWPHFLVRVAEAYKAERHALEQNADAIQRNLEHLSDSLLETTGDLGNAQLREAGRQILSTLDPEFGGFGGAPKFPPSQTMGFLLSLRFPNERFPLEKEEAASLDQALLLCSRALVHGGLFDHVGGGFFRYSVDEGWRVPHFEKMLYDNALILEVLSKLRCRYGSKGIDYAMRATVDWLQREFEVAPGVYASALDADSDEGEGAYYLWSEVMLEEALPANSKLRFCEVFNIHGKDPLNLYPWRANEEEYEWSLPLLADLRATRNERKPPARDDKVILSWNALMIRALCLAGHACGESEWLKLARKGLDWLWEHMAIEEGEWSSVYYLDTGQSGSANLDDTVNFALANLHFAALSDWLEPGISQLYHDRARVLADLVMDQFHDEAYGGYFFCTEKAAKTLIVRKKEWFDNAYPSGNSSVMHLFSLLASWDAEHGDRYRVAVDQMRQVYLDKIRRMPNGIAFGLEGLVWDAIGAVSLNVGRNVDLDALMSKLRERPYRPLRVCLSDQVHADAVQVCFGSKCMAPSKDMETVLEWVVPEA